MRSPRISIVLTGVGRLLPLVIICCGVPSLARAQSALSGIVHDPTSRVAVGATVVIDDNVGGRWEGISNNIGYYEIHLPPGEYNVEAYLDLESGQQLSYIGGVLVLPNENKGLDITLEYRNTEKVTVESGPLPATPLSSNTALGIRLTRDDIQKLPLPNGRTLQSFLSLVPGIVVTDSNGTLAQFTAAGQRRFSNRLTIDGMSADLGIEIIGPGIGEAGSGTLPALSTIGSTQTLVPLAAIDEIQVHTTNASPEDARSPGAQMSVITRAGANHFEGSAFVDWRPNGLGASDWFINSGAMPLRKTTLSNTGISAGGPLLKNRLFYFASWEREQINRAITSTIHVPSIATREAVSMRGDVEARAILDAYPLPNGPELGEGSGLAERTQAFPADSNLNALSVRLDGNVSSKHRVFARFNGGKSSGDEINPDVQLPPMSYTSTEGTKTRTATAGVSSVLSSRISNELKANVSVNRGSAIASSAPYGDATTLPLTLLVPPGVSASDAWVFFKLYNDPGGSLESGRTSASALSQFEVADSLSYIRGRHTFRFGMDYRRVTISTDWAPNRYSYSFLNLKNFVTTGKLQRYSMEQYSPAKAKLENWSAFVQDTFRVGQRLSVDYGVRYVVAPTPVSLNDLQPLLINYETLSPTYSEFLPSGTSLWKTSWTNAAPQVGATYQLRTTPHFETSLRAGWSLTFDELTGVGAVPFGSGYPYDKSNIVFTPSYFPLSASALTAPLSQTFSFTDASRYYSFAKGFRTPRTYSWTIGLDQALGGAQRLGVAYVGTAGRDLSYRHGYYSQDAPLALINAYSNEATSDYNALLVEYVRPFSHGFQARLAYTWSHALDIDSGETSPWLLPNPPAALAHLPASNNKGSADYDRRHVFQVSASYRVPTLGASKLLRSISEEWQIDVVGTMRSGSPFTPFIAGRALEFGFYDVRPDLTGQPIWIGDPTSPTGWMLNPNAFAMSADQRQGTLGRNTLRASPLHQVDLTLSRAIRIGDHRVAQVRVEALNVFNLPNFGPPLAQFGNDGLPAPNFGLPIHSYADTLGTGTLQRGGLTPLQQVGGPRSIRLGLRFNF